jgi:hypothetical protein
VWAFQPAHYFDFFRNIPGEWPKTSLGTPNDEEDDMDPISGMKIASAAVPSGAEAAQQTNGSDSAGASFRDVLDDKMQVSEPKDVGSAEPVPPTQAVDATPMKERMEAFVTDVLADEDALDRMMTRARSGAPMQNHELLELQGLMYAYAQKVDIATKVVEKTAGGVKQLMQTQV